MTDYDPWAGLPGWKTATTQSKLQQQKPELRRPNPALFQMSTVLLTAGVVAAWMYERPEISLLCCGLAVAAAYAGHKAYTRAKDSYELIKRVSVELRVEPSPRMVRKMVFQKKQLTELVIEYPIHVRRDAIAEDEDTQPGRSSGLKTLTGIVRDLFGVDTTATLNAKKRRITFRPRVRLDPFVEKVAAVTGGVFRGGSVSIKEASAPFPAFEKITVKYGHIGAQIVSTPAGRTRLATLFAQRIPSQADLKPVWKLSEDTVDFVLRAPFPSMVRNTSDGWPEDIMTHAEYKAMRIPFGVDEDGNELFWQPSVIPHGYIIGGTGTGKTATLHTITTFVSRYFCTWILDGKNTEFTGFDGWPNVEFIGQGPEQQGWMLAALVRLMLTRNMRVEQRIDRVEDLQPVFVIIDEFASFREAAKAWWQRIKVKGDPATPPFFDFVANLARLARTAKIHLIIGIQRPDTTLMPGELRDNCGFHVSLGDLSPDGSLMMWKNPFTGVEPRSGPRPRGRGVTGGGVERSQPTEFLGYYTPDPKSDLSDEDRTQLESLKASVNRYPRRVLRDPELTADENGVIIPATWTDWQTCVRVLADSDEGRAISEKRYQTALAATPGIDADEVGTSSLVLVAPVLAEATEPERTFHEEVTAWPEHSTQINQLQIGDCFEYDERMWMCVDTDPQSDTILVTAAPFGSTDEGVGLEVFDFEVSETVTVHAQPTPDVEPQLSGAAY